jgi:hypothetical protein
MNKQDYSKKLTYLLFYYCRHINLKILIIWLDEITYKKI